MIDIVGRANVPAQFEQVPDGRVEVLGFQHTPVQAGRIQGTSELDIKLHPPNARQIELLRVEEHPPEQFPRGLPSGGIARTQLAIDLKQRLVLRHDPVLAESLGEHDAAFVFLREDHAEFSDAALGDRLQGRDRYRRVRLATAKDFPGLGIDEVVGEHRAVMLGIGQQVLLEARQELLSRLPELLQAARRHFAPLANDLAADLDLLGQPRAEHGLGDAPLEGPGPVGTNLGDLVEPAEDLGVARQSERAQEDRAEKLALAVDSHVQQVLLVVIELDPAAAVRNDLAEEVVAVARRARRLEEHAGRAVQLGDDDALGAADDEGAVVGHQRDVPEEDLLFLDVANRLLARGVLLVDRELERDLQRRGVVHPALATFVDVVLELQADGVAALLAEGDGVLGVLPAVVAEQALRTLGVAHDHLAAILAPRPQVREPDQAAALAFPVADRVADELQRAHLAEIRDRKDRLEDRVEADLVALSGELFHLQESLVRLPLDIDQVRDRDRRGNSGKVLAFGLPPMRVRNHSFVHTRLLLAARRSRAFE